MRTARLAGHYFMVMGTASILGMIVYPILGEPFTLDFSFIISLWMGWALLDGRAVARTIAVTLGLFGILACIGFLIYVANASGPVGGSEPRTPLLASVQASVALAFMLFPVVLLLLPESRRWFAECRGAPDRYEFSGRVFGVYVAVSLALIGFGLAMDRLPGTAEPSGKSGGFEYGDRKLGIAAAQWMQDKASGRPLYVSWIAFADADSFGASSEYDGKFRFGQHSIDVSRLKPVRFLGQPLADDESRANVLIVRKDGTVTRLGKRVHPDQLEAALDVTKGIRDFDEIQRPIEVLLPAPTVAPSR